MLSDREVEAALGFNPAPGSPGVMWELQRRVESRAITLTAAGDGLDRVSAESWTGHGADSFHGTLHNLRRDVRTAADAHNDYANALHAYVSEQESAKTRAQSLAQEALAARAKGAHAELDDVVRRARALQAHMDDVAGQAARRISAAAERAPYAPPGWLEQAWDSVASESTSAWILVTSPDFLHGLSTALNIVTAVFAFIPGLEWIALVTAVLAIALDVLLEWRETGQVNVDDVALDVALLATPELRLARILRGIPGPLRKAVEGGVVGAGAAAASDLVDKRGLDGADVGAGALSGAAMAFAGHGATAGLTRGGTGALRRPARPSPFREQVPL